MRRERARGFTMIEVLVVMGIIAVLAAIAIANYLTALQRARQKRTMADMRSLAMAWEARAVEIRGYNAAGFTFPEEAVTPSDLSAILVPTYSKVFPAADGWQRPFAFGIEEPFGGATTAATYAIRSAGSDGAFQGSTYVEGATSEFECDLVYSMGRFVVYPATR